MYHCGFHGLQLDERQFAAGGGIPKESSDVVRRHNHSSFRAERKAGERRVDFSRRVKHAVFAEPDHLARLYALFDGRVTQMKTISAEIQTSRKFALHIMRHLPAVAGDQSFSAISAPIDASMSP